VFKVYLVTALLIKELYHVQYFGSFFFSSSSSSSFTAGYCGHCLPIQSSPNHSGLWLLYVRFLFPLSSNPLQFHPSSFSVIFVLSRFFHSDSQYLFCRFSLFALAVCLRHINISDFINFTLPIHNGERKMYTIYPLFVLILQLSSFVWEYEVFL